MFGQPFKVQHLHAARIQLVQDICFGSAGVAIEQDQPEIKRIDVQHSVDQSSVGFVAALNDIRTPADLRQHPAKRA